MPTIRPYEPSDLEAVENLVRGLQADMDQWFDRNLPAEDLDASYMAELFVEYLANGAIFVAETDNGVVGYAMLILGQEGDKDEVPHTFAEVKEIMVSPDHRGQGIGDDLLRACEAYARDNGERWLRIALFAGNKGAHRKYRDFGFQDLVILMEKPIEG